MWRIGSTIATALLFLVVISAGVASAQYNYPTTPQPTKPPNQSTTPGTEYTVNVAVATVHGKRERILTDARGMALYYFTSDTPTKAACVGGCAKTWPPLLSKTTPTHPAALSGKVGAGNDANGRQVSYNGHLLYTYSRDTAPGLAAGDGLYGKWFVAKPGLAAAVASGRPSATDSSKGEALVKGNSANTGGTI